MKDISNLMCSIARHKSITSINIFTHAAKGIISLHGWVVKGNVHFSDKDTDKKKESFELDDEYIENATGNFTLYSEENRPKSKPITLSDVRRAYGKEGVHMVIYACHSGLDKEYLGKVAKLFGIPVQGFSSEIGYHPISRSNKIISWEYFVKPSATVKQLKMVKSFVHLTPDIGPINPP